MGLGVGLGLAVVAVMEIRVDGGKGFWPPGDCLVPPGLFLKLARILTDSLYRGETGKESCVYMCMEFVLSCI